MMLKNLFICRCRIIVGSLYDAMIVQARAERNHFQLCRAQPIIAFQCKGGGFFTSLQIAFLSYNTYNQLITIQSFIIRTRFANTTKTSHLCIIFFKYGKGIKQHTEEGMGKNALSQGESHTAGDSRPRGGVPRYRQSLDSRWKMGGTEGRTHAHP